MAFYMAKHSTLPFEEIVRRSGEIARATVLAPGTQTSYPTREELSPSLFNDYVPRGRFSSKWMWIHFKNPERRGIENYFWLLILLGPLKEEQFSEYIKIIFLKERKQKSITMTLVCWSFAPAETAEAMFRLSLHSFRASVKIRLERASV